MDATHLHLMINHFPIIGTLFGFFLLLIGMISKNNAMKISGLATFAIVAIIAIPTYFSGEEAEELIEDLPGISHELIEEHEASAKIAFPFAISLGIFSILVLFFRKKTEKLYNISCYTLLALAVITFALFANTGNTGGQIRLHERIQSIEFNIETEEKE